MNLTKYLIVINNEPKTLQIDSIQNNGSYGYSVRFKNGNKTYNYDYNKVQWLSEPIWVAPTHNLGKFSIEVQKSEGFQA